MTDKLTIRNCNGKRIDLMIDPANTIQCSNTHVEWKLSKNQYYRLAYESDGAQWWNEDGLTVLFSCPELGLEGVKFPGSEVRA
jgi:hypothetical protein